MTVATNALYTPGAIGNVTKRTGDIGQGLEPDEGQLSRPVLRGLVSGNTHRLPGGVTCTALAPALWDDRITRRRVPSAFDPQGPRQPDEAIIVALVIEIQAFHGRPTCGRRPHNPLPIRSPCKMRGPALP